MTEIAIVIVRLRVCSGYRSLSSAMSSAGRLLPKQLIPFAFLPGNASYATIGDIRWTRLSSQLLAN
jgi:hypothetical protein